MIDTLKSIVSFLFGLGIELVSVLAIIAILFFFCIHLPLKLSKQRRNSKLLYLRWERFRQKLDDRLGVKDIKAYLKHAKTISQHSKFADARYPLVDSNDHLLKQQPLESQLTLSFLERHLADELGEPLPVRPSRFIKRTF